MNMKFSCLQCGTHGCEKEEGTFPPNCLTTLAIDNDVIEESLAEYNDNQEVRELAIAAAQVEADYYCKATRAEETVHLCRRLGITKVGIACCGGLKKEGKAFAKILESNGLIPYGVICKAGNRDKLDIGLTEEEKVKPNGFEPMCNPILQAKLLNKEQTELNVIIGLCVGHDSLFTKYSDALVTTLVAKDRVLAHNSVAALTNLDGYYKKLNSIDE